MRRSARCSWPSSERAPGQADRLERLLELRLATRRSENLQDIDEETLGESRGAKAPRMGEMMEMLSEVDASVCHLCESPRSVAATEEDERPVSLHPECL